MRCSFCSRQAAHEFKEIRLCESCGMAYREGFEHGRVYAMADLRARFDKKVKR